MLKDRESKQSIQVTVRVRPLSQKELNDDPRICVKYDQTHSLQLHGAGQIRKFTFDTICFNESQEQIFERVGRKCTLECLEGYNCTIFAYGQTGAGKTYTMMGVNFQHQRYYEERGLIPRTMQFLFQCIQEERETGVNFVIRCSFLEIYNEQIIDLLNKSNTNLQLREDTRKGVYVEGLTQQMVSSSQEAMDIVCKGSKSRHVGSTFYNEASSRSHSVFTMQIESRHVKNGVINTRQRQFNFIDLAGSERTKQSTGQRLKEGCNINKSLMNLATVINSLSEVSEGKSQHINYRNSKLTFLLKDSLGGNSRTNLIANISPASSFYQETLSTLGFARRAKLIKREKACINQDSSGNIESMKNEIKRLKQQIITLMSQQSQSRIKQEPSATPNQMTAFMHQYVSQQIQKQTKLQMEILKLHDRIFKLQTGIKQYSNSDINLRMIISVYEDKINRLKDIEKIFSQKVQQLNYGDEHTKTVIQYFKAQKANLIKEIEALKKQGYANRFIKELLKEAQVIKQEGEDESIKDLLSKNTIFLSSIHSKLNDIHQEKKEELSDTQFQKKICVLQREFNKKQEENTERIQQLKLQLNQYKNRNDQNQKLLEQTVGFQIILQQKAKQDQKQIIKWKKQVEAVKQKAKNIEKEMVISCEDQTLAEFKQQLVRSKQQIQTLKRQIDTLRNRLQKSLINQKILKQQFHQLQQQKYKVDKIAFKNIQGIRDYKNELIKYQSDIAVMQQKIKNLTEQTQQANKNYHYIKQELAQYKKSHQINTQSFQNRQKATIIAVEQKKNYLVLELKAKNQKIAYLQSELAKSTEQLNTLKMPFMLKQREFQQSSNSIDNSIELTQLGKQKNIDQEESLCQFDKTLQLQSRISAKDCSQTKLNSSIDFNEKLNKQKDTRQILDKQTSQNTQVLDQLDQEYQLNANQTLNMSEMIIKLNSTIQNLQNQIHKVNNKKLQILAQLQKLRQCDKDQSITIVQLKNELIVVQKNRQVQIQAFQSQIILKDQRIQYLEKQSSKNKARFLSQIQQLQQQLTKSKQFFQEHQQSTKRNMENHLALKQKKILQMKGLLQGLEQQLKIISDQKGKADFKIQMITSEKTSLQLQISAKNKQIAEIEIHLSQKAVQIEELNYSHSEQLQEIYIIHGHQLDQKNQQIQTYMNENETLNNQIIQLKQKVQQFSKKAKQSNQIVQDFRDLQSKNNQSDSFKQQILHRQQQLQFLKSQISLYQLQSEQTAQNIRTLKDNNQQIIAQYEYQIKNLLKQNQSLRDQKQQLEYCEIQSRQEFIQSSKQINQLTKALQNQRQTIYNMSITQKSLEEQIKSVQEDRNHTIDQLNQLRKQLEQKITTNESADNQQIKNLQQQKIALSNQNVCLLKTIKDLQIENKALYQKLQNYSQTMNKTASSLESLSVYKQKNQTQNNQIQKIKNQLELKQAEYSKLFNELCQGKDNQNNYKNFIDNLQTQITQLQSDLEEKDLAYKKLVQKIAKNQNQNKRSVASEHYQKTSDLLQKSRAQQLQLRRQNQQYKKVIDQLTQDLDEKDAYVKEVESNSEAYCIAIHKQIQQIQTDYVQLQNKHQRLSKQKRTLQKQVYDNQMLRASIAKLSQRNEELQSRLKKVTFDYNQLQNQFTDSKKGLFISTSADEKNTCINRLRAEVTALKNEKMLIVQSLNKEREEKNKLKAEFKYGRDNGDTGLKTEMERKIKQNKNLQDLIFDIINQLKITVQQPKAKLEDIRSIIIGSIKQRNNQIRFLRQKVKQCQQQLQHTTFQMEQQQSRQLRSLNISNVRNITSIEECKSIQKQQQRSSIKKSRQRNKQFQNYYARFRQTEESRSRR